MITKIKFKINTSTCFPEDKDRSKNYVSSKINIYFGNDDDYGTMIAESPPYKYERGEYEYACNDAAEWAKNKLIESFKKLLNT